jgi:hypothetical protein
MAKTEVRLSVLLSDGARTAELFWLKQNGNELYYHLSQLKGYHFSYHESGQRHHKTDSEHELIEQSIPVPQFKGQKDLFQLGFAKRTLDSPCMSASGRKADVRVVVDSRTLKENMNYLLRIGLLEPGNLSSLRLSLPHIGVRQVVVGTVFQPWVYAIVGEHIPIGKVGDLGGLHEPE